MKQIKKDDKRLLKEPKYKIGDIIVYQDRYDDGGMIKLYQSNITESYSLLESDDPYDELSWYYNTEQTIRNEDDPLEETDILYKL